jgi:DNA-binding response OmpR family regulator
MAGTEHILVVDDEEGIRLQLDEFLTSEGYRVTVVPDGAGLRQVMDNGDIDLVLLDLHLPGEDGITIARDYLSKTDVGVIMLTSRTEIMDRVVGLEVGADDYIPKP